MGQTPYRKNDPAPDTLALAAVVSAIVIGANKPCDATARRR